MSVVVVMAKKSHKQGYTVFIVGPELSCSSVVLYMWLLESTLLGAALTGLMLTQLSVPHSAWSCSATSIRCRPSCGAWDQAGTLNVSVSHCLGLLMKTLCTDHAAVNTSCWDGWRKAGRLFRHFTRCPVLLQHLKQSGLARNTFGQSVFWSRLWGPLM